MVGAGAVRPHELSNLVFSLLLLAAILRGPGTCTSIRRVRCRLEGGCWSDGACLVVTEIELDLRLSRLLN